MPISAMAHLDRVRRAQRVEVESAPLHVGDELLPHLPLGVELRRDPRLHPGGKALVEPEVVPPCHRDEVAKPLVGELMDHHLCHALPLPRRRRLVNQQVHLAVGDQPPVLHRPRGKLGDGYHVGLGQGVGLAKGLIVAVEGVARALERERTQLRLARRAENSDQHAALGQGRNVVKLAHHEGQQVGAHARALEEGDGLGAVGVRERGRLGHVGKRRHVRRHAQRARERRLAQRLVPAWEYFACVDGLTLRGDHQLLFALDVGVLAAVEAVHLVVVIAREGEGQHARPGRKRRGKGGGHRALTKRDGGGGAHALEAGGVDLELVGVQRHRSHRLDQRHRDRHRPIKLVLLDSQRKVQFV